MKKNKGPFPHVFPNIKDWKIHKLHADRANFIKAINKEVFSRYKNKSNEEISKLIAKTIYSERIRIKEEPWKVDPPNEKIFWGKISKNLILDQDDEESKIKNLTILKKMQKMEINKTFFLIYK